MVDLIETGKVIRQKMKEKNFTAKSLGIRLGMSHQAVYSWLYGVSCPSVDTLLELRKVFNCSIDDLIVEDGVCRKNK